MSDRKAAPYIFHSQVTSLCADCLAPVPTKVIFEGDCVYYLKRCRTHGVQKVLVSTDIAYFKACADWLKPGDRPQRFDTRIDMGCPYDCGLCPDHEQHSCLALIEVNEHCNLTCPMCFAGSSPEKTGTRSLEEIGAMMDALVAAEGEPDLLQISGGEPTLHPQILEILAMAKARPIRHLMINTNGLRIARDPAFVAELAKLKPGFEVYLQFDSLRPDVLKALRGADLTRIRQQALENLEAAGISTTLVAVIRKGLNDDEVGAIIDHALNWSCVRGVTFQPVQDAGRNIGFDPAKDRTVLSDIRRAVIEADNPFGANDMIPLPCNPESICVGYGLRKGRNVAPITGMLPREVLLSELPNSVTFEKYPALRDRMFEFFSFSSTPANTTERLEALFCCLPEMPTTENIGYDDLFRIAISEFLDPHNFDLGRVKRSCVHFVTPDQGIIPFDTYNLFYRDEAARARKAGSIKARLTNMGAHE
ncbi:radical SAM protein [Pseudoprimorskyibacter insulae]|uniref:Mycofactocin radical SAM maturase MftC n=1 Tax=Pseudoprimorskyibacter insulae TaxID=1695997 RepID=A0A2R8AW38_9RHOB|nr:radical SAM protein [Pseudoprimorskyibacter insulae]SPF80137.1 Putative mycofactocin radical SAM maturase MftC [Pseudoprimorskyibacter insulae]